MRLTVEQRAEIAVLYPSKSMDQLALEYNISKTAVHKIIMKAYLEQWWTGPALDDRGYQLSKMIDIW
jgi:hypothetical protein